MRKFRFIIGSKWFPISLSLRQALSSTIASIFFVHLPPADRISFGSHSWWTGLLIWKPNHRWTSTIAAYDVPWTLPSRRRKNCCHWQYATRSNFYNEKSHGKFNWPRSNFSILVVEHSVSKIGDTVVGLNLTENRLVPDSCCITVRDKCGLRDHPSNIPYTVSWTFSTNSCKMCTIASWSVLHILGLHLQISGWTSRSFEQKESKLPKG